MYKSVATELATALTDIDMINKCFRFLSRGLDSKSDHYDEEDIDWPYNFLDLRGVKRHDLTLTGYQDVISLFAHWWSPIHCQNCVLNSQKITCKAPCLLDASNFPCIIDEESIPTYDQVQRSINKFPKK